jgi:hypothetical protein
MRNLAMMLATVLAGAWLCPGCSMPVRGPDGNVEATIKEGTLTATMDRGIDRVFRAVQDTVRELGLTTITSQQDGVAAEVLARDAQGQNVTIRLEAISASQTSLMMRVGILGDKNKSRVIFREIQENMRTA